MRNQLGRKGSKDGENKELLLYKIRLMHNLMIIGEDLLCRDGRCIWIIKRIGRGKHSEMSGECTMICAGECQCGKVQKESNSNSMCILYVMDITAMRYPCIHVAQVVVHTREPRWLAYSFRSKL